MKLERRIPKDEVAELEQRVEELRESARRFYARAMKKHSFSDHREFTRLRKLADDIEDRVTEERRRRRSQIRAVYAPMARGGMHDDDWGKDF